MVTKQIESQAYVLGINKTSLLKDFFRIFYTLINKYVADPRSRTKWIYSEFPSNNIDDGSLSLPVGVIEVDLDWDKFTLLKRWANANILVEFYSTKKEQVDGLIQETIADLSANQGDLHSIRIRNLKLMGTDSDTFFRRETGFKTHMKRATFTCRYSWAI